MVIIGHINIRMPTTMHIVIFNVYTEICIYIYIHKIDQNCAINSSHMCMYSVEEGRTTNVMKYPLAAVFSQTFTHSKIP